MHFGYRGEASVVPRALSRGAQVIGMRCAGASLCPSCVSNPLQFAKYVDQSVVRAWDGVHIVNGVPLGAALFGFSQFFGFQGCDAIV